jgi:hypothetical protein
VAGVGAGVEFALAIEVGPRAARHGARAVL